MRDKIGRDRCRNGHLYTKESAHIDTRGTFVCRICKRNKLRLLNNSILTGDYPASKAERNAALRASKTRQTHCKNGHEYTESTTDTANNARRCLVCLAERNFKRNASRRPGESRSTWFARLTIEARQKALEEFKK